MIGNGKCEIPKIWEVYGEETNEIVGRTNSRRLEKMIKSASGVSNRKLRIDVGVLKEMLEDREIE